MTHIPAIIKASDPHVIDPSVSVSLGQYADVPSTRSLSCPPEDHLTLPVTVPTHSTQNTTRVRETRRGGGGESIES